MTSVPDAGLLNPFGVSGYPELDGPLIGKSTMNGNPWYFDAWSPYRHDGTSVNAWVAGLMGSGKSMFLKAFGSRETTPPWNRKVIIEGDPNNEWAAVAHSVGGQVIQVGSGSYLNPLDPGEPATGQDMRAWRKTVLGIQRDALEAIAHVLRPERRLDSAERAVIAAALRHFLDVGRTPTLITFVDLLQSEWVRSYDFRGLDAQTAVESANSLILLYDQVVTGVESGAFECDSTIEIDPNSPMLVFDTGSVNDQNERKKQLYMAAMSSIVERLCARQDGQFRIIIAEEGHELLKNPVLVDAWEHRMRMSGHLGVSSWMLLHELSDLDKFAKAGTEHRNKINSILTLSGTQVIYKQSAASLELMKSLLRNLTVAEVKTIESLSPYSALWRVGDQVRDVVQAYFSPAAATIMRNDENRA
ncbi:ATP-binding protein [Bifidobacterium xylocopae]|uniref:ATP-binding protein n=2 Tax=Bifidobacterium xylocopae TaxID=2493119 RepID=A0A366KC65_9BIFI|nr:ATP-binding protein [Bifidobacterium xylocopae]